MNREVHRLIRKLGTQGREPRAGRYANLFTSSAVALLCLSATAQTLPPPVERQVTYAVDVHPILAERCYRCHAPDKLRGGLSMESRETLLKGSENGPVITIGDSASSVLIKAVAAINKDLVMPPKGDRVPDREIGILRAWIDQGLEWDLSVTPAPTWEDSIHPRRPEVPGGDGIDDSVNPIDRFVAAYFEEHPIHLRAPVDDRTFARRAYLHTIGLLPTVDELNDFLFHAGIGGGKADARAELVDELLARDRDYAEHWMTFWNDALRNDFQGTGYIDGGRKQISQWLYDALYYNMPYDEFARQLIHPSDGARGFTDGIVWRGVVPAAERTPVQAARSVAQVFLGVNLKCASCHDSFVDEWRLTDAYGLANCFSNEPLELVRCDVPQGVTAETKFLWPELGAIDASKPRGEKMKRLAELVTVDENGRFARTIVNRVWERLMGRGFVEPLDEMYRKPWDPDLLDWLASEFQTMDYDLRALLRLVMTSKAYQLQSAGAGEGRGGPFTFQGPTPSRLTAEAFNDAVSRVTGVWQQEPKFSPPDTHDAGEGVGVRAWRVPADALTRALGRPNREQVVTRRPLEYTTLQALELTNGVVFNQFLVRGAEKLAGEFPGPDAIINAVYRRALQRPPSEEERATALTILGDSISPERVQDFVWSIAMLPEFQVIY